MQYRRLGDAGIKVSAIGLGGWINYGEGKMSQEAAGEVVGAAHEAKSNSATRLADWLKTPQNNFRRSGSAVLLRLLRLAGAFFSALALDFLPPSAPSAASSASAASASARSSLRLTTLRAIGWVANDQRKDPVR